MKLAFHKFFTVSSKERALFFEAWVFSFFARLKLIFTPFSIYSKRLGKHNYLPEEVSDFDIELVAKIKQAIKRAVAYSVWRNKCLEQSVTAKKMLKKRGISSTIYFGVRKTNNKLEAHAWVKIGDTFVVGERNHETFTVVAYYS